MSSNELTLQDGKLLTAAETENDSGVPDFTPPTNSNPDGRVYVNGTRVPAGDIDIHWRREGPAAATSYCEVEVISPYEGTDYINTFQGIETETQDSFDELRVEVQDYETGDYFTQFYGLVTGVGNGTGMSRVFDCRAQGIGQFLNSVTADKTFLAEDQQIQSETVIRYLIAQLNETLPPTVTTATTATEPATVDVSLKEYILSGLGTSPEGSRFNKIVTDKTFTPNRHTLKDVVAWLEGKTDTRIWFVPTADGAAILQQRSPQITNHRAHYLGGDLRVVSNDAFAELRPANTLIGKGSALKSYQNDDGSFGFSGKTSRFAQVTARHETLYERAGENALQARSQLETDAQSMTEVENDTRRALASAIEETTGGSMETLLRAPLLPYDTILAQPTCDEQQGTNTDPLTYQVDRVQFRLRGGEYSTCDINVGIRVDPNEDITIADRAWKDVKG